MKYKEAIIEIVGKIRSEKTLKRIYKFVLYLFSVIHTVEQFKQDNLTTAKVYIVRMLFSFVITAQ